MDFLQTYPITYKNNACYAVVLSMKIAKCLVCVVIALMHFLHFHPTANNAATQRQGFYLLAGNVYERRHIMTIQFVLLDLVVIFSILFIN